MLVGLVMIEKNATPRDTCALLPTKSFSGILVLLSRDFRSLKDLGSDRGAETYDFTLPLEEKAKERQRQMEARKKDNKLEQEMENYWGTDTTGDDMEEPEPEKPEQVTEEMESEEKRGTKRSARERLGKKRVPMDR